MSTQLTNEWLRRAFLYVEAALSQEIVTPGRVCMTEDYFRSALVRGLLASRPELAGRVVTEKTAPWSSSNCGFCGQTPGRGRPIQHDIAISEDNGNLEVLCEVKWLKGANPDGVAKDICKLLISRGTTQESRATRCYLLLGGEASAFSETFQRLRESGVDFRWSRGGRGDTRTTREFCMRSFLNSDMGRKAVGSVCGWSQNPRHFRRFEPIWEKVKLSRRSDPWLQVVERVKWRAVLFELHHRGASNQESLDFLTMLVGNSVSCRP
jgi:hypothetical protein